MPSVVPSLMVIDAFSDNVLKIPSAMPSVAVIDDFSDGIIGLKFLLCSSASLQGKVCQNIPQA